MAGFFRRVAGAFVELEPRTGPIEPPPPFVPPAPEPPPDPDPGALTATPEDLFAQAGLVDGPNSALRLTRIVEGLAAFPPDQRLAMVRALDAADPTWDEASVLADARAREQALREHLDRVEREHGRQLAELAEQVSLARAHGDEVLADIDRRIAELYALRDEAETETTQAVAALDEERLRVDRSRDRAQRAVADTRDRLAALVSFFGGAR